jgi:hypothetical protein
MTGRRRVSRGWYSIELFNGVPDATTIRLHFTDWRTWRALLAVALDLIAWWPGTPAKPRSIG